MITKKVKTEILIILSVLNLVTFISGFDNRFRLIPFQSANLQNSQTIDLNFNYTNAYNHIKSQIDIGFRVPGTLNHSKCADWIQSKMIPISDEIIIHNFTIQEVECKNILAKLNTNQESILILGAHWDSRAIAEKDPVSENRSLPIPGANDGGSGVGVLIELGRILFEIKETINSQIWFLFIDAEDQGSGGITGWNWCDGSAEFTHNIDMFYNETSEVINGFILLDMVGGYNLTFIEEAESSISLQSAIFNQGRVLGYNDAFPINPKKMSIIDDHRNFVDIGIPSVDLIIDFISGPWTHHHKHSDNLTNIDPNSLHIIGTTLESFIISNYVNKNPIPWDINPNPQWVEILTIGGLIFIIGGFMFYIVKQKKNKMKN